MRFRCHARTVVSSRRVSELAKHVRPIRIDETVVLAWAQATLEEWLPGMTDYDDVLGVQYRIRHVAENTYEVGTIDGWTAGRFAVVITVLEVQ